jgi:hypothetical protein
MSNTNEPTVSIVDLSARIDAEDIVKGLNNNDDLILMFIVQMLDHAGSSELEGELINRVKERLGVVEAIVMADTELAVGTARS